MAAGDSVLELEALGFYTGGRGGSLGRNDKRKIWSVCEAERAFTNRNVFPELTADNVFATFNEESF